MRPSRRHRCSCWLRDRCSCWLRHRCSCWLRHRCSERRRARPPARRPRRELRSARRLEARPGPAGPSTPSTLVARGVRCALRDQAHFALSLCAASSLRPQSMSHAIPPATISNHEIAALELQRFLPLLNLRPIELHATFVWSGPVVCRETITCEYLHSAQSVCTAAP